MEFDMVFKDYRGKKSLYSA
uniref:Uncharacterized protein n=1 Tax=Anguilla anguilla TaxID=7936 RepID=A0A0E9XCS2_ANGAN